MNSYENRLRKLEPIRQIEIRLADVGIRLMRYAIERRYVVFKDGTPISPSPGDAGGVAFEAIYEKMKVHSSYGEMYAEVQSGNFIYCKS